MVAEKPHDLSKFLLTSSYNFCSRWLCLLLSVLALLVTVVSIVVICGIIPDDARDSVALRQLSLGQRAIVEDEEVCDLTNITYHFPPNGPPYTSSGWPLHNFDHQLLKYYLRDFEALQHEEDQVSSVVKKASLQRPPNADAIPWEGAFVIAVSSNHFNEAMDAIASIQACFHQPKIIYYDLGLSVSQRARVCTWCNVELRTFDYSRYPRYFSHPSTARWKPVLSHEVLREYPAIFFLDAAIRFNCTDAALFDEFWYGGVSKARESGGALFIQVFHSTYPVLHPNMYKYLPTNLSELMSHRQLEISGMMMYARRDFMLRVIRWWVLCALEPWCQHPYKTIDDMNTERRGGWCNFQGDKVWANCSIQDQSTYNLLLLNHVSFNWSRIAHIPRPVERKHTLYRGEMRPYVLHKINEPTYFYQVNICTNTVCMIHQLRNKLYLVVLCLTFLTCAIIGKTKFKKYNIGAKLF